MRQDRGNILFLILLAVVLFAALSYAVTQGMRGGGNNASNESAQAKVSELNNYFAQMDAAVTRMMMTGGVKDYELNFYYLANNNYVAGNNDNTNCTTSNCRVFDPAGGAVSGRKMTSFTRGTLSNPERIFLLKVPGAGTDKLDIVYGFHNVDLNICREVNKKIGQSDILYGVSWTHTNDGYNLPYLYPSIAGPIIENSNGINVPTNIGQTGTFCFCEYSTEAECSGTSGGYVYNPQMIHVLVAR